MTTQETSGGTRLRVYPPPPKDFNPFTAGVDDLKKHGLPLRPDPHTQPGLAALWERQARRYRSFEHLEPRLNVATSAERAITPFILPLDPTETCGFSLLTTRATIGALFITWTVPDLQYSPSPIGAPNQFHTFVGLGFADLHVMMTVDSAENVTSSLWAEGVGDINLPVRPGDGMSASLCFAGNPQGTVAYFLANETTGQTMNFAVDTGFPPAVTVDAGVTRSGNPDQPPDFNPLARFAAVYFDDISIFTTSGPMSLTSGTAVTMIDENGNGLATPVTLTDYAFKVVYAAA